MSAFLATDRIASLQWNFGVAVAAKIVDRRAID
jgi:hypothetical protein